jgi:hypothetical protein
MLICWIGRADRTGLPRIFSFRVCWKIFQAQKILWGRPWKLIQKKLCDARRVKGLPTLRRIASRFFSCLISEEIRHFSRHLPVQKFSGRSVRPAGECITPSFRR